MRLNEALQVFGLDNAKNMSQMEMQKLFRALAKDNHPDMGGDTLTMQMINDAWETFKTAYQKDSHWFDWAAAQNKAEYDVVELFRDILSKVQHLSGLDLTISGSWLWIGGNTKFHSDILKANGCRFSAKKKLWSWHPPEQGKSKRYRKTVTQDKIYEKYGSQKVSAHSYTTIR